MSPIQVAHAVLKTNITPSASEEGGMMSNERTTQQGAVISALRQRLSMTQEEFAHAIGVTVSTVNRWENGHIGLPSGPQSRTGPRRPGSDPGRPRWQRR
jgi:DNA-binding transcriptional regulator YiaG